MKTFVILAAIGIVSANALFAQDTQQSSVIGASGDTVYSVQVSGSDGVTYNCLPNLRVENGIRYRDCIRDGAALAGNGTLLGGTLSGSSAAGAIVVALVVAAAFGDDGTVATTTNP
ncbi:MAG: hypothetical protein P8Q26_00735 [Ascidiaceihabitans sp.]|jgi:hypothetical protein|nr:hypothetical protein [Ascidiaceihabitans sp.]